MPYKDPEKRKAVIKAWQQNNPDLVYAASRRWKEKNREHHQAYMKAYSYKWRLGRYGFTPETFADLWKKQKGLCANKGCGYDLSGPRGFHIDHDHGCCPPETGCERCVRGILCPDCNLALGMLQESADRLRGLAKYVLSHPLKGGLSVVGLAD